LLELSSLPSFIYVYISYPTHQHFLVPITMV
jgi:hypothetical protein